MGSNMDCRSNTGVMRSVKKFLVSKGIEELRFWNHQWRANRETVLLEIWNALHRRTGCVAVMRKMQNHRFVPPKVSD